MILINLLLIANIVVFIVDNTDLIDNIKKFLWKNTPPLVQSYLETSGL